MSAVVATDSIARRTGLYRLPYVMRACYSVATRERCGVTVSGALYARIYAVSANAHARARFDSVRSE